MYTIMYSEYQIVHIYIKNKAVWSGAVDDYQQHGKKIGKKF